MNFMGIDPAIIQSGIAVINEDGKIIYNKLIKNINNNGYEILANISETLIHCVSEFNPIAIGREDILYGGFYEQGIDRSSDLAYIAGVIDLTLGKVGYTDNNLRLKKIPNTTWQKYVWGKANKYNKKINPAEYAGGMSSFLNHPYKENELDLADAHAVAITIKDIWLISEDLIDVLTLDIRRIEALLSNRCCKAVSTGKKTVANKVLNLRNRELFHAFAGFEAPNYAIPRTISMGKVTGFAYSYNKKLNEYYMKKNRVFDESVKNEYIQDTLDLIFDVKRTKNLHQNINTKRSKKLKIIT